MLGPGELLQHDKPCVCVRIYMMYIRNVRMYVHILYNIGSSPRNSPGLGHQFGDSRYCMRYVGCTIYIAVHLVATEICGGVQQCLYIHSILPQPLICRPEYDRGRRFSINSVTSGYHTENTGSPSDTISVSLLYF